MHGFVHSICSSHIFTLLTQFKQMFKMLPSFSHYLTDWAILRSPISCQVCATLT